MTSPPLFTAHGIPDLLGLLPTRFGFTPQESLCAIMTSGPRCRLGFSLRLDLPPREHAVQAASLAVRHLRDQGAEGAIVLALSQDPGAAGHAVRVLEASLGGIQPVVGAWATSSRYWTTFEDCDPFGHPYDPTITHAGVARAVVEGQEILPDRDALVRRYRPEEGERRRRLGRGMEESVVQVSETVRSCDLPMREVGRRTVEHVLGCTAPGTLPPEKDLQRLLVWLTCRPVLLDLCRRASAHPDQGPLAFWGHVARLAPDGFAAGPLCLAALAAYARGDGAQARVAAERAVDQDPSHEVARLVLGCLDGALVPAAVRSVVEMLAEDAWR